MPGRAQDVRSRERGEPQREWHGLRLLRIHGPGLGPEPIEAPVDEVLPSIVMGRVLGEPLGTQPITSEQFGVHRLTRSAASFDPCDPGRFHTLLLRACADRAGP